MSKRLQDAGEPELRLLLDTVKAAAARTAQELGLNHPSVVLLLFDDPESPRVATNASDEAALRALVGVTVRALQEAADRLNAPR